MSEAASPSAAEKDAPLYEIIRDQLIDEIASGRGYPAGALLPSIREITVNWTVSTTTARKVLAELVAAGYARSEGTRGYVSTGPHAAEPESPALSQGEAATASPLIVRTPQTVGYADAVSSDRVTVDVREEIPPAEVALALRLGDPSSRVTVRRRLALDQQGTAIQLRTSYMRPETARDTLLSDPRVIEGNWEAALAEHVNAEVSTVGRYVTARHPTDSEAAMLGISLTACVLARVQVTAALGDGIPIDYTVTVWPGERTRLDIMPDVETP